MTDQPEHFSPFPPMTVWIGSPQRQHKLARRWGVWQNTRPSYQQFNVYDLTGGYLLTQQDIDGAEVEIPGGFCGDVTAAFEHMMGYLSNVIIVSGRAGLPLRHILIVDTTHADAVFHVTTLSYENGFAVETRIVDPSTGQRLQRE
jgi:hypothetical protein